MNVISLIMAALQGLSSVMLNPNVQGGNGKRMKDAANILGILTELLGRGDEAHEELKAFAEIIQRMADEKRNPTPEEWATLKARSDAAHDVIQDAAAEAAEPVPVDRGGNPLEPDPEPEPDVTEEPEPPNEPTE
ncbi:MAG TPA: hypothetical protein VMW50_05965 [Dehalococcoidia bacterium]|jgi:hypothetical protein|nr:hypothetical protein [Dehalococcoidia bacterium]